MIRTTDIRDGKLNFKDARYVNKEIFDRWTRRASVETGDVLLTREAPIGEVCRIPNDENHYFLGQRIMQYRADPKQIDPLFLYYSFCSNFLKNQFLAHDGSGSVVSHIRVADCHEFKIPLAPISEQSSIGRMLAALDDKIDLNRRTNETLEAMARALFRDWFVDFGPTRAKMAGQTPYLAPEIWELFPDRLDDEGKPEGWINSLVGRQFDVTMGQSPPGDTYNPDGIGIPFYQGKTDFSTIFPQRRMYCTAPTRFANTLDSLVSVRAPVGDVNLSEEKCCIGRGLASVRHPQSLPYYTYFTMKFLRDVFSSFESNGTVFGSINKKQFEELFVIKSGLEKVFESQVMPTCAKIVSNETESRTLAQLRDLLLPKLMSGEIRIRDAEKMVADAL
ncbi:restriction endonuclease subunit S [Komagataeibacter oboediens]|uniref:restriction endonuclease subunit S n=1 Tax=Komagataeibacter oboediens TaxID=65958 RepID=UPI001C2CA2DF|nr:restriction endonuclease subunit S [Komagataeibacter oboediens]MBV0888845.1 restriction endonuclease subunit S [Komagataeibacter oboediens]MCK9821509.1 restriction endonuclease subunit S [Komagataeibacter oboediens]